MLKHPCLAMTVLAAAMSLTSVTHADDEIEVGDKPVATPSEATPMITTGGPFKKATQGISVGVAGATNLIDYVYFLNDKAAVDVLASVSLHIIPEVKDMAGAVIQPSATVFGFAAGLGYRIYKHTGPIHTYLQPFGLIASADVGNVADFLAIQLGANFGVEGFVVEWFSFRAQIGGVLQFASAKGATLTDIQVASTTGLFANMYWK